MLGILGIFSFGESGDSPGVPERATGRDLHRLMDDFDTVTVSHVSIGWAKSIHIEQLLKWLSTRGHDISIITDNPKNIEGVRVYEIRRKLGLRPHRERYKEFYFF